MIFLNLLLKGKRSRQIHFRMKFYPVLWNHLFDNVLFNFNFIYLLFVYDFMYDFCKKHKGICLLNQSTICNVFIITFLGNLPNDLIRSEGNCFILN